MDTIRDNQQVITEDIAWLAGIIDGEGSLSIVKQYKKQGVGLNPKATMENTSPELVENYCRILDNLGITFYIYERKAKSKKHKDRYIVQICRIDMIDKFCNALIPYLVAKKSQAKLLQRYAQSRLKAIGNKYYQDVEREMCDQIQELNRLGPVNTSTTLRETLDKQKKIKVRWTNKRR